MGKLVHEYFIVVLIMLSGCLSESDRAHRIYIKEKFTIEILTTGDFGEFQTLIEIDRKTRKGFFEILSAEDVIKAGPFSLTPAKEKVLKEFIYQGIAPKGSDVCTDYSSYKIGDFWNALEFEDASCEMYKYVEQLIEQD